MKTCVTIKPYLDYEDQEGEAKKRKKLASKEDISNIMIHKRYDSRGYKYVEGSFNEKSNIDPEILAYKVNGSFPFGGEIRIYEYNKFFIKEKDD